MIQRASVFLALPRLGTALVLCVLGLALSGCGDMSEGMSTAFADPAQFDLYDCKQLEATRKNLATRAAELQGLIAKAQTGFAGPVVGELAYRNDYIAVRGQEHFAEEAWRSNKCKETPAATTPAAAQSAATAKAAAHAKHKPPMTAGSTVN